MSEIDKAEDIVVTLTEATPIGRTLIVQRSVCRDGKAHIEEIPLVSIDGAGQVYHHGKLVSSMDEMADALEDVIRSATVYGEENRRLQARVAELESALATALAELEPITDWSGSSGNWSLHAAVAKARAALGKKQ